MNIVVLAGGNSTERNVSLVSGKEVYKALSTYEDLNVILLDVSGNYDNKDLSIEVSADSDFEYKKIFESDIDWEDKIKNVSLSEKSYFGKNVLNICMASDAVFLALHGKNGEDGKIQATFDLMGIRYTGTDYLSAAISMDKGITKKVFLTSNVPTPKAYSLLKGEKDENFDNVFPKVIKVKNGGSSIGVYIANNEDEYNKALDKAFEIENEVLIEEFIKGREFSIGVIDGKALPIIEIVPKEGFYDYETKYTKGKADDICPAPLSKEITEKMQKEAQNAFRALRLHNYARIDFMLDENDNCYCLEANTLPGMTPTSLLPQEAAVTGVSFRELCRQIIENSMR